MDRHLRKGKDKLYCRLPRQKQLETWRELYIANKDKDKAMNKQKVWKCNV